MKIKATISAVLFIVLALVVTKPAAADQYGTCTGQYGQYGNCQTSQSIFIEKMVGMPNTASIAANQANYVKNLSSTDAKFSPNQFVFFRLRVKNTSGVKLTNVTVKDYIPGYINPVEGPGSYDSNTRIITFNAGDFNVDEEKIFYLKTQAVAQNQLPADQNVTCVTNKAQAYTDNTSDDDTAQFCIEKQVVGVPSVPSTGPEMGVLLFSGELAALGAGLFLKKKVS